GDSVSPCYGHPFIVEAGGDAIVVIGAVHVLLDVFLAAPDNLDWMAQLLANERCLYDEVELKPSAEATAEEMVVDTHLIDGESTHARYGFLRSRRNLRADPYIAGTRRHGYRTIHWLHCSVR